jgi:hypothetical protein
MACFHFIGTKGQLQSIVLAFLTGGVLAYTQQVLDALLVGAQ